MSARFGEGNRLQGLFTVRQIVWVILGFVSLVLAVDRGGSAACHLFGIIDSPVFWPFSVFSTRVPSFENMAVAVFVVIGFFFFSRFVCGDRVKIIGVAAAGIALIIGSTLIQGWGLGFLTPIAGGNPPEQYWHDAIRIHDPVEFLRRFISLQPGLLTHARTHPPGAVLAIWALDRLCGGNPSILALVLGVVSSGLMAWAFYGIARNELTPIAASRLTWLYFLVPAVQIYTLASLDALIAALLLIAVHLFIKRGSWRSILGSALCIFAVSLLSFAFLFVLPVLAGLAWRRRIGRLGIVLILLVAMHAVLFAFTGFNYWIAFRQAAAMENPGGFQLWVDPATYALTRLEGLIEIVWFLGPFLGLAFVRGIRSGISGGVLERVTGLGVGTLIAMLLVGAFRTGETARCCFFIYPYLLFQSGWLVKSSLASKQDFLTLSWLVFLQALVMQLFGFYFW